MSPVQGATRLLLDRNLDAETFTLNRETDSHTALTRGLREYLEQLTVGWVDGREERFVAVYDTWAVAEDTLQYPSAAVYAEGENTYAGGESGGPLTPTVETDPATNTQVSRPAEPMLVLTVEIWAQDNEQRMAICAMLEDAFFPVDWMSGFRLALPHYHGMVADYLVKTSRYMDDPESVQRRYRKASFTLDARLPLVRVLGPGIRMRRRVNIAVDSVPARVAGEVPETIPEFPPE
jgi:hypothetical protein